MAVQQGAYIRLGGQLHVLAQGGVLWRSLPSATSHSAAAGLLPGRHRDRAGHPRRHATPERSSVSSPATVAENNSFRLVIDGEIVAGVPGTTGREKACSTHRPEGLTTPCPV